MSGRVCKFFGECYFIGKYRKEPKECSQEDLDDINEVCFSGTPCKIEYLNLSLQKDPKAREIYINELRKGGMNL